jgi:hypothetical protein
MRGSWWRRGRVAPAIVGALVAGALAAAAANTTFVTSIGDLVFPFSPPDRSGNAGAIDNMVIGATTARAGTFSSLKTNGTAADAGLVCASYYFTGTPAATDQVFFVATRPYLLVAASEVHATAAGGASALQLVKDTGTAAPGAGTDLLTAAFDLNATANTVQVGALVASSATKTLAAGDRLSVDFANAIQSSAGVVVTACLAPQ